MVIIYNPPILFYTKEIIAHFKVKVKLKFDEKYFPLQNSAHNIIISAKIGRSILIMAIVFAIIILHVC